MDVLGARCMDGLGATVMHVFGKMAHGRMNDLVWQQILIAPTRRSSGETIDSACLVPNQHLPVTPKGNHAVSMSPRTLAGHSKYFPLQRKLSKGAMDLTLKLEVVTRTRQSPWSVGALGLAGRNSGLMGCGAAAPHRIHVTLSTIILMSATCHHAFICIYI